MSWLGSSINSLCTSDDARHVAFSGRFGELDDCTPYTKMGKKHRLDFEQLFDVSNLLEDGSVAPLDSHRAAMNKVQTRFAQYGSLLNA